MDDKDMGEIMREILGTLAGQRKVGTKALAKLTPAEIAEWVELEGITKTTDDTINRLKSKQREKFERFWRLVQNNHDLHGKNLSFNDETGEVFELLP